MRGDKERLLAALAQVYHKLAHTDEEKRRVDALALGCVPAAEWLAACRRHEDEHNDN